MSTSKKMYLFVSCATMISMTSFCSEPEGQLEPQATQQPDLREELENPRKESWSRDQVQFIKESIAKNIAPQLNCPEVKAVATFVTGGFLGGFKDKTVGRFMGSMRGAARTGVIGLAIGCIVWQQERIFDAADHYKKEVDKTHAIQSK